MNYTIKNADIEIYNDSESFSFPKYTSQLINWANQNAQGTRPKVVGQMSELFPEFLESDEEKTIEGWRKWYTERYPDAFQNATDKIWEQVVNLKNAIPLMVQEAPEDWDTQYFIDFYVYSSRNELIGIQLKPETFYMGRYQYKVDIRGKMNAFCRDKNARAFILKYSVASDRSGIIFTNPEVINEIQTYL